MILVTAGAFEMTISWTGLLCIHNDEKLTTPNRPHLILELETSRQICQATSVQLVKMWYEFITATLYTTLLMKSGMLVSLHATFSVCTALLNASFTVALCTAHECGDARSATRFIIVYIVSHLCPPAVSTVPSVKYEDVLQAEFRVWKTMGQPDLVPME